MGLFNFLIQGNGDSNGNGHERTGPVVRRSRYDRLRSENEGLLSENEALLSERDTLSDKILGLETLVASYRVAVPELDRTIIHARHQYANVMSVVGDMAEKTQKATEEIERLKSLHIDKVRVGCLPKMEAARITARLRAIEPSIRVEDGEREFIIYADRRVSEAAVRGIESELGVKVDRT